MTNHAKFDRAACICIKEDDLVIVKLFTKNFVNVCMLRF